MKVFSRMSKFCVVAALAVTAALSSFNPVFAEEEAPDFGLAISPSTLELADLKPGETLNGAFTLQNTGKKDCNFTLTVQPFSVSGENYEKDLETVTKYNDIINWITFSDSTGVLKAGESKEIEFRVQVPKDVPDGGQYGTIIAEATNDEDELASASISLGRRVGLIFYSQVSGKTRIAGSVEENKIPGILFNPPISATSIVENTGNTHITATYTLQVFPLFSDEEIYTNEENPATSLIMPETRRFNTISWDDAPHFGVFKVKQTVNAFGQDDVTEKIIVICPIWLLFILILAIFCLIFWIITRIRARKQS